MGKIETAIVSAICAELTYKEKLGQLSFIRNNTGTFFPSYTYKKGIRKGKTITRKVAFGKEGSADIIVFLKNGRTVFLEAKQQGAKQQPEQIKFQDLVKKLGFEYCLVYTPRDIDKIF